MLVTFEGIDGSGKSTQARLLVERLDAAGYLTLPVREPGGTVLSERVRTLLLDPGLRIEPLAELLLFSAARAQLVAERIRPALEAGRVVVCDRFYDSTTAYQGGGRGVEEPDWLSAFHLHVTGGLVPDRTYLVEVDPATALVRRGGRSAAAAPEGAVSPETDRMEQAGERFYERVAASYAALAEAAPERIRRLDGSRSIPEIHEQIWADLMRLMTARRGTAPIPKGSSA